MTRAWGAFFALALASASPVHGQEPTSTSRSFAGSGADWKSMSELRRWAFVVTVSETVGWMRAMVKAFDSDSALRSYASNNRRYGAMATLSPAQRIAVRNAVDEVLGEFPLKKDDVGPVVGIMDRLYADPANDKVPQYWMAQVALARLRGASADSVEGRLAVMRAAAAEVSQ